MISAITIRHAGLDPASQAAEGDAWPRGRALPNQVQHDNIVLEELLK